MIKTDLDDDELISTRDGGKKSADKMFEELGYEKEYYRADDITYTLRSEENKYEKNYITFYLDNHIIYVDKSITMQELRAINKKVEELGWK